jgi:hypothetical protein
MQIPTMRLSMSKDYIRPQKTQTERMQSKNELKEYLKDYEEIETDDVNFIPMGTLVRYISYDKKNRKELFRYGGIVKKIAKEYLVLSGKNGLSFSVQRATMDDNGNVIHTTRFFRRLSPELKIKTEYEDALDKSEEVIEKQSSIIEKQKKELMTLKKMIQELEHSKRR